MWNGESDLSLDVSDRQGSYSPGRTRTYNPLVNSQLLCLLSYRGMAGDMRFQNRDLIDIAYPGQGALVRSDARRCLENHEFFSH